MKVKYIGDSCCEFPEDFRKSHDCENVPLTIEVGDYVIKDDASFDQAKFLKKVAQYPKAPRSACPSPEDYLRSYDATADIIFVSTLSMHLSGSYNSAVLSSRLWLEEHPDKKIHVFNSDSASSGEMQALIHAASCIEKGMNFEDTVEETERFIRDDLATYFVLESLDHLRKNGRLSGWKAFAANAMNIKPVCAGDHGVIVQAAMARGMRNSLRKMVSLSLDRVKDTAGRILMITHVNCRERAEEVLADYISRARFMATYIIDARGVSSLYAADGGIIVTL